MGNFSVNLTSKILSLEKNRDLLRFRCRSNGAFFISNLFVHCLEHSVAKVNRSFVQLEMFMLFVIVKKDLLFILIIASCCEAGMVIEIE